MQYITVPGSERAAHPRPGHCEAVLEPFIERSARGEALRRIGKRPVSHVRSRLAPPSSDLVQFLGTDRILIAWRGRLTGHDRMSPLSELIQLTRLRGSRRSCAVCISRTVMLWPNARSTSSRSWVLGA